MRNYFPVFFSLFNVISCHLNYINGLTVIGVIVIAVIAVIGRGVCLCVDVHKYPQLSRQQFG